MNELLWVLMLIGNFVLITIAHKLFGKKGLFMWVVIAAIIANIQVTKTVDLFWMAASLGNIVYATSFLATDILSEYYGKEEAKRAVYIGLFTILVATILMQVALWFKPIAEDFAHESLVNIFGIMPRIALGSITAYFVSQRHDIWAYAFWKKKTNKIWIANNASTMVSQLIDSLIFVTIAFAGVFPFGVLVQIFITTYVLKWIVAAADTPFVYLAKRHVREEGE